MRRAVIFALVCATSAAWAEPPKQSLRPIARNEVPVLILVPQATETAPQIAPVIEEPVQRAGFWKTLRPKSRGKDVEAVAKTKTARLAKGAICGTPEIQGETIAPIKGSIAGCGLADGVKVRSVSGIALSTPATIDCTTAKALNKWAKTSLKSQLGKKGGGVSQINVVASYNCRTRNNQKGERISEHGRGKAIDIAGFKLANGATVTVLNDWNSRPYGKSLKALHKSACGPFGTVLGPNANRFHQDHFHFDTARYRSGAYCK